MQRLFDSAGLFEAHKFPHDHPIESDEWKYYGVQQLERIMARTPNLVGDAF